MKAPDSTKGYRRSILVTRGFEFVMSKAKKRVYWLSENPTTIQKHRGLLLAERGFDVQFFRSVRDIITKLDTIRASIFIVDDQVATNQIINNISLIANHPSIQGARIVFSISKPNDAWSMRAAACAFRDIIPLQLSDQNWIQRFLYATSGKSYRWGESGPSIAMNAISAITLPARFVWLSDHHIQVESKLSPTPGSQIQISGCLLNKLSVSKVTVEVEETNRHNLRFRFSNSFVGKFNKPLILAKSILTDDSDLAAFGHDASKIFVISMSANIRRQILDELDSREFLVNFALQKHSMTEEPVYFVPDVVLIEDKLCSGAYEDRFRKMLSQLKQEVPVIVIGTNAKQGRLQKFDPRRPIHLFSKVPPNLRNILLQKYINKSDVQHNSSERKFLSSEHDFSYGAVHIPARLKQVSPDSATLSLTQEISNFGICKIESPLLNHAISRYPFAKITSTNQVNDLANENFSQEVRCIFSDVSPHEKNLIAKQLVDHLMDAYNIKSPGESSAVKVSNSHLARSDIKNDPVSRTKMDTSDTRPREAKAAESQSTAVIGELTKAIKDIALNPTLRMIIAYVGFLVFAISVLHFAINYVSEHYEKSGGEFTESLKKFAPQKFPDK